jgi:thioredoxin 1
MPGTWVGPVNCIEVSKYLLFAILFAFLFMETGVIEGRISMSGINTVQINSANWKSEVLDSKIPVLVDFWAEWCGPCKAIAPILDELAGEVSGKLKVAKVNVDDNQQLAGQFGIRSIPTLLVIKDGVVQSQMVGAMNKAALKDKLSAYLQ